jgi:hypothetical protein
MKIDASDGTIGFDAGLIASGVTRTQFLQTALGKNAKEELVNPQGQWRHIAIDPEPGIAVTLIFQDERLHQAFIAMRISTDATGEWTEKNEFARKAVHDVWLASQLGEPPYSYSWGSVASTFDYKGCASEIVVTYAT